MVHHVALEKYIVFRQTYPLNGEGYTQQSEVQLVAAATLGNVV